MAPPLLQAPMTVLSRKSSPLHVAITSRSTAPQETRDPSRQNRGRFDAAKNKDHRSAAENLAPAVPEPAYQTAWSTTCGRDLEEYEVVFCLMMFRDLLEDRRGARNLIPIHECNCSDYDHDSDNCYTPVTTQCLPRPVIGDFGPEARTAQGWQNRGRRRV